jgi:shikimate kinase
VRPERAAARLGAEGIAQRPMVLAGEGVAPEARLSELLRERAALYEAASDAILDTDDRTPAEVADQIAALCRPDPTWP